MRFVLLLLAALTLLGAGGTTTAPVTHVILIMEENHSRSQVTASSMPYLTSLAKTYAQATNYHSTGQPSLPNYIELTDGHGSVFQGTDCSPSSSCQVTGDNVFHQAGAAWRVWAESMPSHCDKKNSGEYVVRHTAAPYYTDLANCSTNDVGYPSTPGWGSSKFTLIAPNLCDDAHDCSLQTADNWLKKKVPKLLANPDFTNGSTLIEITFDSGGPSNNVEMVFLNPALHAETLTSSYTHASLLRLNEELLGFSLLGDASSAPDIEPVLGVT